MKRSHRAVSLFLALATFAATPMGLGCAVDASSDGESEAASAAALSSDGEAHFKGVLFGTGVVANALPEIWRNTAQLNQAVSSLSKDRVAADLEEYANTLHSTSMARLIKDKALQIRQGKISEASLQQQARETLAKPGARAHVDALIAAVRAKDAAFFDRFKNEMQSGDRVRIQNALTAAQDLLNNIIPSLGQQPGKPGPRNPGDPGPSEDVVVDTDVAIYVEVVIAVAVAAVVVVVVERPGDLGARLRQETLINTIATRLNPGRVAGGGGGMR